MQARQEVKALSDRLSFEAVGPESRPFVLLSIRRSHKVAVLIDQSSWGGINPEALTEVIPQRCDDAVGL